MITFLLGIILQLIGGCFWGAGFFYGSDARRVRYHTQKHLSKRVEVFKLRAFELIEGHFNKATVITLLVLPFIILILILFLIFIPVILGLAPVATTYNAAGVLLFCYVFLIVIDAKELDEFRYMFMLPLGGLVPFTFVVPIVVSLFFDLSVTQKILATILLLASLQISYFVSAIAAWIISRFTKNREGSALDIGQNRQD